MTKPDCPYSDLKVLYLEDEALIAFDTSEHLRDMGFGEVTCAYRLKHAEAAAADQHYDVAIFDINVDGNQTSVALGEQLARSGTKMIFASGSTPEMDRLRELGYRIVGKPFTLAQLSKEIDEALAEPACEIIRLVG